MISCGLPPAEALLTAHNAARPNTASRRLNLTVRSDSRADQRMQLPPERWREPWRGSSQCLACMSCLLIAPAQKSRGSSGHPQYPLVDCFWLPRCNVNSAASALIGFRTSYATAVVSACYAKARGVLPCTPMRHTAAPWSPALRPCRVVRRMRLTLTDCHPLRPFRCALLHTFRAFLVNWCQLPVCP